MAQVIDNLPDGTTARKSRTEAEKLVAWIMSRVNEWIQDRDNKHESRWEDYYRLWRGIWSEQDKNRKSERSRIITPALQQAVEGVTSEVESAVLDKAAFFDMIDDVSDPDNADIARMRTLLREDMKDADFESAMNQIFLMGSLWGTGIGKLTVGEKDCLYLRRGDNGPEAAVETRTQITLTAVLPAQFAIDTGAKTIKEALGVAHVYTTPRHEVEALQDKGIYYSDELGASSAQEDPVLSDEDPDALADTVNLTEYHGKVPKSLLDKATTERLEAENNVEIVDVLADMEVADEDSTLVEAIVTIGNGMVLLKAVENPTLLKERLFFAYRHETVPDQFWGRGVSEKGYNSQKALDASVRARLDGLALTVHPMMGIDSSKMPRGFTFNVSPGKTVLTVGDPSQVLQPIKFGNIDPNAFTNTAELERMVSMSTGGFDTAAPTQVNNRNETLGGMSIQMGAFVKRSKRTIRNIENEFIVPMVSTVARLYMQFDPDRYPTADVKFKAVSVLGTMARELEQSQFAQMLATGTAVAGTPAFWMLVKSVYQLSSLSNREEMVAMIDLQLQKSLNPPPPPPDPLVELKRMEIMGKIRAEAARISVEYIRAQAEVARAANEARTAASEEAKLESEAILNLAKAESEELGRNIGLYKAQLDALEREAANQKGLAENVITGTAQAGAGTALNDLLNFGVGAQAQGIAGPA